MSKNQPQNFENHSRLIPMWHYVTALAIVALVVYNVYLVFTSFSVGSLAGLVTSLVLASIWIFARLFALTAQDRIIRLEERIRLARLLPDELKSRIGEIPTKQLIALRFASDEELAELTADVLSGALTEPKDIKKRVKRWRADNERV